jgi:hypothetical protein
MVDRKVITRSPIDHPPKLESGDLCAEEFEALLLMLATQREQPHLTRVHLAPNPRFLAKHFPTLLSVLIRSTRILLSLTNVWVAFLTKLENSISPLARPRDLLRPGKR